MSNEENNDLDALDVFNTPNTNETTVTTNPVSKPTPKQSKQTKTKDTNNAASVELDTEESLETRALIAAATINGIIYKFPYNKPESLDIPLRLAATFIKGNLVKGQIFTVNFTMNSFLIIPELNFRGNSTNPYYTYNEELADTAITKLVASIHSGVLLIGRFEVTVPKPQLSNSLLDCKTLLDMPLSIVRGDVKKLIATQTFVNKDGTIVSPGVDLRALLDYELKNKNRVDYVALIRQGLKMIGSSLEFIDKMTEVEPVGKDNGGKAPVTSFNPNASTSM